MAYILHLVTDDKFIDAGAYQFTTVNPGLHRFVILGRRRSLRRIKSTPIEFVRCRDLSRQLRTDHCIGVICHHLSWRYASLLNGLPSHIPLAWIGWGADYYSRLLKAKYPNGLLMPHTRRVISGLLWRQIKRALRNLPRSAVELLHPLDLGRVDVFSPVLPCEFRLIRELNPSFTPTYVQWNYGQALLESNEMKPKVDYAYKPNVLIGNSGTPTNNHIDLFVAIAKSEMPSNARVIVPLSYPKSERSYQNKVISSGRKLFGKRFVPLVEWMNLNEYLKVTDSCGVALFGHLRQQGGGNVSRMLATGARVYLMEQNPLVEHNRSRGAVIESLDPILFGDQSFDWNNLPMTLQNVNRRAMEFRGNRDMCFARTKEFVSSIVTHPRVVNQKN